MNNNVITVFNQLTQKELTDCALFESILNDHYEKFKFFYTTLECLDLKSIKSIDCITTKQSIEMIIYTNNKSIKNLNTCISNGLKDSKCKYKDFFRFYIETEKNQINISITNNNFDNEVTLYED